MIVNELQKGGGRLLPNYIYDLYMLNSQVTYFKALIYE